MDAAVRDLETQPGLLRQEGYRRLGIAPPEREEMEGDSPAAIVARFADTKMGEALALLLMRMSGVDPSAFQQPATVIDADAPRLPSPRPTVEEANVPDDVRRMLAAAKYLPPAMTAGFILKKAREDAAAGDNTLQRLIADAAPVPDERMREYVDAMAAQNPAPIFQAYVRWIRDSWMLYLNIVAEIRKATGIRPSAATASSRAERSDMEEMTGPGDTGL